MKRMRTMLFTFLSCLSLFSSGAEKIEESNLDLNTTPWTSLSIRMAFDSESLEENAAPPVRGVALGLGGIAIDGTLDGLGLGLPVIASQGGSGLMISGLLSYSIGGGEQSNPTCWKGLQASLAVSGANGLSGVQVGLIGAGADHLRGIQLGGLMADSERLAGVSAGGLFASASTGCGVVTSPCVTSTGNALALANAPSLPFRGIQLACIANFAMDVRGVQVALGANVANECRGVQAALFYNRANELHGFQVGLINVARSGAGVQVGLINTFGTDQDRSVLPLLNARF